MIKSIVKQSSLNYLIYEVFLLITKPYVYCRYIYDFFKTKHEFKFQTTSTNHKYIGKNCLIVAFGTVYSTKLESILAYRLLKLGWKVDVLVQSHNPWIKRYFDILGLPSVTHINKFKIEQNIVNKINNQEINIDFNNLNFKTIKKIKYKDVIIGPTVLSNVMRFYKTAMIFTKPDFMRLFKNNLIDAMKNVHRSKKILNHYNPNLIYLIEPNDVNKPLVDLSIKKNIKVIMINQNIRDDGLILKLLNKKTYGFHPNSITKETLKLVSKNKWKQSYEEKLSEDFENRYGGKWKLYERNQSDTKFFQKDELIKTLKLNKNKKIAVVFSHVLWDANLFYGTDIFNDYGDWFINTIKIIQNNNDVNWIVKLHPANLWKKKLEKDNSELAEITLLKKKGVWPLPDNIKLLYPNTRISTLSLYKSIDYGITVRGTSGLELPCFGVQTITAGTGRYSDLGFTIDPKNKSEYKTVLDNIVNLPKLSNEKTKLAKIHAYTIFCRRPWIFNSFKVKFEKLENLNPFIQNLNLTKKDKFLCDSHDIIDWTDWITNENANPDYLNKS